MAITRTQSNAIASASYDRATGTVRAKRVYDFTGAADGGDESWSAVTNVDGDTGDGIAPTIDMVVYPRRFVDHTTDESREVKLVEVARDARRMAPNYTRVTVQYEGHVWGVVDWSIAIGTQAERLDEALEDATTFSGADGPGRKINQDGSGINRLAPTTVMRIVDNHPREANQHIVDTTLWYVRALTGTVNEAAWMPGCMEPYHIHFAEGAWLYAGAEMRRHRDMSFTLTHTFLADHPGTLTIGDPPIVWTFNNSQPMHEYHWYKYKWAPINAGVGRRTASERDGTVNVSKIYPIAGTDIGTAFWMLGL